MNFPQSDRIRLVPLSVDELKMYIRNDFSFETHFRLQHHPRVLEESNRIKLENKILPALTEQPEHHLFHTLWVAMDKQINTAVAGIVFKGPPNEHDEVELGAGTFAGFMNRGYMTETTKLMCEWALNNGVKKVVANCSPENVASQRTLIKCGFEIVTKNVENWNWRYLSPA